MVPFMEANKDVETQPEKWIDEGNVKSSVMAPGSHVKRNMKGSDAEEKRVSEVG